MKMAEYARLRQTNPEALGLGNGPGGVRTNTGVDTYPQKDTPAKNTEVFGIPNEEFYAMTREQRKQFHADREVAQKKFERDKREAAAKVAIEAVPNPHRRFVNRPITDGPGSGPGAKTAHKRRVEIFSKQADDWDAEQKVKKERNDYLASDQYTTTKEDLESVRSRAEGGDIEEVNRAASLLDAGLHSEAAKIADKLQLAQLDRAEEKCVKAGKRELKTRTLAQQALEELQALQGNSQTDPNNEETSNNEK